ncbi:MAG TPA: DUF433 domain-containing protein [Bryobacteraceae bacterium]|nr:DUF433 domain-containing protein [Bryobacteraceae bacterium]
MTQKQPKAYKHYRWIIADSRWLGGKPAIRGTRLSVAQILECLGAGMTLEDINESFGGGVPPEAITEVLEFQHSLVDPVDLVLTCRNNS